jgi:hypothetical protein
LSGGLDPRLKLANAKENQFWLKLETIILPLIKSFSIATNMVQQDSATLLTLNTALIGMKKAITDCKIASGLGVTEAKELSFKISANSCINNRINSYIAAPDHYAFGAVSILPDQSNASEFDHKETSKWIAGWGADLIQLYPAHFPTVKGVDNNDNNSGAHHRNNLMSTLKRQLAQFEGGLSQFSDKSQYLKDYTKEIQNNSFDYDEKQPDKREIDRLISCCIGAKCVEQFPNLVELHYVYFQ